MFHRTSLSVRMAPLALAFVLAGCNMAPKYVAPDLPVPPVTTGNVNDGPALSSAEAETFAQTAYQDFFLDPRLRETLGIALENNRDLRIAMANVEMARARYGVQRADQLPTFGAQAQVGVQNAPVGGFGRMDSYALGVGVSAWEIDLFGRIANMSSSAREQYFASQDNQNAARVALIAEVANAWLTVATNREHLRLAQETEKAFSKTVELTEARFNGGIASMLEVRQARTSHAQARSDIEELNASVAQSINLLNLLAGKQLETNLLPVTLEETGITIEQLPDNLPSDVLLQRPDIASAEHQLRSANADIGAARAAFFPKISLTALFGTISTSLSGLFGAGSNQWSVAPGAVLPIFDYGRNKNNLRYSEANRDAMIAQYEKSVQTGFREVADALARRATIDEQLDAQKSLKDNSAQAYTLAHARYRQGLDPFLVSLDAQRHLYSAERSLLTTRLIKQMNAVEVYRSVGGGLK